LAVREPMEGVVEAGLSSGRPMGAGRCGAGPSRAAPPDSAPLPQNDVGGEKLLQKKWTTFLKAQLLCAQRGQLPFNVIRHAVLLQAESPSVSRIYAVFTSQW
jgi:hypothetical protein